MFYLLGDLNKEHAEQSSLVSPMNGLLKTIFSIKLKFCLLWDENLTINVQRLPQCHWCIPFQDHLSRKTYIDSQLCLLGDLNNEYAEVSPTSPTWKLCLPSVTDVWPCQDHLLSRTIYQLDVLYLPSQRGVLGFTISNLEENSPPGAKKWQFLHSCCQTGSNIVHDVIILKNSNIEEMFQIWMLPSWKGKRVKIKKSSGHSVHKNWLMNKTVTASVLLC